MCLSSVVADTGVLNIPFLFRDTAHAHAVLDGSIGESFRASFAAKDVVMLAWGENGLRHMTNSRHPITTPDDIKGLKMRVPQSEVLLRGFQALGVETAVLPFPQLYEALRAGAFDGQENPIATIRAAKFDQVQKFLTMSGHAYDPAVFIMSADLSNDLSADDKAGLAKRPARAPWPRAGLPPMPRRPAWWRCSRVEWRCSRTSTVSASQPPWRPPARNSSSASAGT
jgi:TRAP-type transport system periplasmic protein